MTRTIGSLLVLGVVAWFAVAAQAQLPSLDPTLRSGDQPPLLREEPRRGPGQVLPPVVPPPLVEPSEPFAGEQVLVKDIRVVGSTVFSAEELARITAPYVNRKLSTEDLEALRRALTVLY